MWVPGRSRTTGAVEYGGRSDGPAPQVATPATLSARANAVIVALCDLPLNAKVGEGKAQIGGGTLPRSVIPSVTLDLIPASMTLSELAARLRSGTPPVIGYISGGRFKLDLRTIFPQQDEELVRGVRDAASKSPQ